MDSAKIDIGYVAELARLDVSAEQREQLSRELNDIVGYIAELAEADVTGVEPTAHAAAVTNIWREDKVLPFEGREAILANAPRRMGEDGELVQVPQVLPGEGMN